jgi:hypothetical protein
MTSPEFDSNFVAGCLSLRTALGSSGMWTGANKLFCSGGVSCSTDDVLSAVDLVDELEALGALFRNGLPMGMDIG